MTDLASALAQSPGGLPQAISLYEAAARILPDSPIIRGNLAQARYDFGMSLIKQGLAADSIPQFEAALLLRPDSPEIHNNLAIALAQTGNMKTAEQRFREALRLKPDYAEAHLNLGITLDQTTAAPPKRSPNSKPPTGFNPTPRFRKTSIACASLPRPQGLRASSLLTEMIVGRLPGVI